MKFYNRSKVVYGLVDENGCLIKDNISSKELKMMLNLHSSVNLDVYLTWDNHYKDYTIVERDKYKKVCIYDNKDNVKYYAIENGEFYRVDLKTHDKIMVEPVEKDNRMYIYTIDSHIIDIEKVMIQNFNLSNLQNYGVIYLDNNHRNLSVDNMFIVEPSDYILFMKAKEELTLNNESMYILYMDGRRNSEFYTVNGLYAVIRKISKIYHEKAHHFQLKKRPITLERRITR